MDPFVKIFFEGKDQKTKVRDDVGKNPVWNEKKTFNVKDKNNDFTFKVMDEDFTSNDLSGEVVVKADVFTYPKPPTDF